MAAYVQAERPLSVTTPLKKDALLLIGFSGTEGLSQLFSYQLDMIAENKTEIPFDKLLGQKVVVALGLSGGKKRYYSGICSRLGQGGRDKVFTTYRMEIVPQLWLLTRKAQSRIFQHLSVPDILKKVLEGLDVAYEIQGTFHPRDYCVQYRETDFAFASRLMEEEGIYYYFKHAADGHKMVVANTPKSHADLPDGSKIIYEEVKGGKRDDLRIWEWNKMQELQSGKYTLWDHCFELPHKHLEAEKPIIDSIPFGEATHKLKVGNNDRLEIYDFPGEYAQRFDGVASGGGDQPTELQKIFEDNKRTVNLRMQEGACASVEIQGASNCRQMISGHKFTLERHFNANGTYVLTRVKHASKVTSDYRSGDFSGFDYENTFTCIPAALPFLPPRTTPKPTVFGTQTAVVVGPPGDEIFTDKYGRVKVQFHWDREGKNNADSSCWVRVSQIWAGKRWGASFWPRIGQEVIVDFIEGDLDNPIIIGSVYNADQMPPYLGNGLDTKHTNDNKVSGVKTNSTPGGVGYNELRFDDTKSKEQIFIHAERNMDTRVKNDLMERVLNNRHLVVGGEKDGQKWGDQREMIYQDKHLHVHRHHVEHIAGNMMLLIGGAEGGGDQDVLIKKDKKETIEKNRFLHVQGNRMEKVDKDQSLIVGGSRIEHIQKDDHLLVDKSQMIQVKGGQSLTVGGDQKESVGGAVHLKVVGNRAEQIGGSQSLTVGGDQQEKVGLKHAVDAGMEIHLKAGMQVVIEGGMQVTLKGPGGFVDISPAGVTIQGTMVLINSGGAAGSGGGSSPAAPEAPAAPEQAQEPPDANEAKPIAPAIADDSKSGNKSAPG